MNRTEMLNRVRGRTKPWDVVVIGGGSTGVGCALDAATRGLQVLLLEQHDFGKGTSSRSTKLVHGGVRYLEQGNLSLVREALKERGLLLRNASHHVTKQSFIIPCYSRFQKIYYGLGLKFYDLLSGKYSFGKSRFLSRPETLEKLPNIESENLAGGVVYFDGQFDDARFLIDLVKTAAKHDATVLNYARVFSLSKTPQQKLKGVSFECVESGELFTVEAKTVINATGAFCDNVRKLSDSNSEKLILPSQGIHLVFDSSFLAGRDAIMIPKTSDGRVLFVIPWNDKTLVGTTDTPIENPVLEPKPIAEEIEFVLNTCKSYLAKPPTVNDVLSVFVGIRPLVKSGAAINTASLSRDHTIEIDKAGLITITGGKWTTYRRMAEDGVNKAVSLLRLPGKASSTKSLKIEATSLAETSDIAFADPDCAKKIHPEFIYLRADVVNAVRNEMALTVEDVLARRTRFLFLDANLAIEVSPKVAAIMAKELGESDAWVDSQIRDFKVVAENYLA